MNSNPQTFAEITPDIIQDWKAKYGQIEQIDIIGDDEQIAASFVVKKPNRQVLEAMAHHGRTNNVAASNKVLLTNTVLGGDMQALEDDAAIYGSLLDELAKLLRKKETRIKKL